MKKIIYKRYVALQLSDILRYPTRYYYPSDNSLTHQVVNSSSKQVTRQPVNSSTCQLFPVYSLTNQVTR